MGRRGREVCSRSARTGRKAEPQRMTVDRLVVCRLTQRAVRREAVQRRRREDRRSVRLSTAALRGQPVEEALMGGGAEPMLPEPDEHWEYGYGPAEAPRDEGFCFSDYDDGDGGDADDSGLPQEVFEDFESQQILPHPPGLFEELAKVCAARRCGDAGSEKGSARTIRSPAPHDAPQWPADAVVIDVGLFGVDLDSSSQPAGTSDPWSQIQHSDADTEASLVDLDDEADEWVLLE
eukprot:TRINITY_DN46969_c0_g1_i1.p1 TRINITY_DN46969_c0_g1~~TRINITY_DN46969_c0_g1_i1.p1  ORF type:complete len:235 (+),score=54.54 TRINITY_DN46969_c0_g1_i1:124-828(+)